ncbi:esterase-like activity of phytase family protein [Novosphingobium sp.]|uniref:esterase-like activity of phytase family protein n=1 Tax=Novosphingobium sp. TaxID=1874826 RepID=UPI0025F3A9F6|nr:esterase-like activity of phytase family protein [Novosphingobium sp.]
MRRRLAALLLTFAAVPGLWWRSPTAAIRHDQSATFSALPFPKNCCSVGNIAVTGAWRITSRNSYAYGYSALISPAAGRLLALSDAGQFMDFASPDQPASAVRIGQMPLGASVEKHKRDVESATRDPLTGRIWIGIEGQGVIVRLSDRLTAERKIINPAIRDWPSNKGPEAMARLADGRFIVLGEGFAGRLEWRRHPALLFQGDPTAGSQAESFLFAGHSGYRPTDMAALPDGRVLIVMRQLRWPFPIRLGVRLMIADPRQIRPGEDWHALDLGEIKAPVPIDNFEGLALVPETNGTVTGWLISDDNGAAFQRTLLLRLRIDPARLPWP